MEDHSYSVLSSLPGGNNETKWRELDSVVEAFMEEQGVPGASVAVSKNQQIIYSQGYGSAGGSKRVQSDSVFRIASISKPITAFAVLHMCVEFNVSLESKVFGKKGILKGYKYKDQRVSSITIRHLLQHSAGWDRDIAGDAAFRRPAVVARCDPESGKHNCALVAYTLQRRLQFKPGSRHAYSNLCYLILGLVVEEVSGLPYHSYLQRCLHSTCGITGIKLGGPWRALWSSREVEYFNNREPELVPSLHPNLGEVLPQYGGLAMASAGPYGGLTANGKTLLQFIHTIDDLRSGKLPHGHRDFMMGENFDKNDFGVDFDFSKLGQLVKESFSRPGYESLGRDWYGLGWDVQDGGESWGHTGGMEGTSCVLFHHASGLNWALLLNAWAKDIDLNGVMKCALSRVPSLAVFDCDISPVRDATGLLDDDCMECGEANYDNDNENGRVLFTKDKSQAIVLSVNESQAYSVTSSFKKKRYVMTWVTAIQHGAGHFLSNFHKDGTAQSKSKISSCCLEFILIFSRQKEYKDYCVLLNQNKDKMLAAILAKEKEGFYIKFVDSFCVPCQDLKFSAVLMKRSICNDDDDSNKTSFHLAVKAESYVRLVKTWVKSHEILCQSVTEVNTELFVSVVLSKRCCQTVCCETKKPLHTSTSSYWVQIEPESFLTELGRKIKQDYSLVYAKFFNADGQSWVSGSWTRGDSVQMSMDQSSHDQVSGGQTTGIYHRTSMSRFGLVPELAEAASENVLLLGLSEYVDDGVVYYAGLWYACQQLPLSGIT